MSISLETRQAYTEIDNFIELIDEYNKNKIPKKLREFFKKEKDTEYIKLINPNQPIDQQNLKKETLALIAMLNLQYWCEDENEKQRLRKIYAENENKYQLELREKFNPDNLFQNKEREIQEEKTAMVEYKELKFFERIKNIFKKILGIR